MNVHTISLLFLYFMHSEMRKKSECIRVIFVLVVLIVGVYGFDFFFSSFRCFMLYFFHIYVPQFKF